MGSKRLLQMQRNLKTFTKVTSNTCSRTFNTIGIAKKMVLEYPIHTAGKKVA